MVFFYDSEGTYCQSGVVETSTPVTSEVPGSIPSHVTEWATLFDRVGLLRGLRFPPTVQLKSPNIVLRANNEQEFAHELSFSLRFG